jgi:release factor glutamine methyltransferase
MTDYSEAMSSNSAPKWREYYADSEAGVAFFDGMFIESDSMTDPRADRVLAILEEEQIFMCRQMAPRLQKGSLVLDVGTGSGVFAIWAALHGCRVLGIDINQRAIDMARKNAERNQITLCDDRSKLVDGSICFLNRKFEDGFNENEEVFDIVLLSPPHNPTYPQIVPALHAEAGEDGQKEFNQQINLVPNMLTIDGYCIGNHMSTINGNNDIEALLKVGEAFSEGHEIQYVRTLPRDIEANIFLEGQYKSYLTAGNDDVKEYINRISINHPKFSLLYFEVKKCKSSKTITEIGNTPQVNANWENRISLHRLIVDHLEPFPCYVRDLFASGTDAFSDLIKKEADVRVVNQTPAYDLWNKSKIRILDRIFKEEKLDEKLDVVIIDTAPFHRDINGSIDSLEQESKVWLGKQITDKPEDLGKDILSEWLSNVKANQKSNIATFQHPSFTGLLPLDEWAAISTKVHDFSVDRTEDPTQTIYNNLLCNERNNLGVASEDILDKDNFLKDFHYSCTTLKEVTAPNIRKYYDELTLLENVFPDEVINLSQVIDRYISSNTKAKEDISNKLKKDLNFRITALHQITDDRVLTQLNNVKYSGSESCSMMISLPLWFYQKSSEETKIETDKLPKSYRGGIWMYILASNRKKLDDCRNSLIRLSKLAWLLYLDEYTLEAVEAESGYKQNQIQNAFGHQMKHIGRAVGSYWLSEVSSFFDVLKADETNIETNTDKLGKIELYSNKYQDKLQLFKLATIPELFRKTETAMTLWSMSNDETDLMNMISSQEITIEDFIRQCYLIAWESQIVFYFRAFDLAQINQYRLGRKRLQDFNSLTNALSENFNIIIQDDVRLIINDSSKNLWLGRALIEIFSNVFRHGALSEQVNVNLQKSLDTSNDYCIEVVNSGLKDKEKINLFLQQIQISSNLDSFASFLAQGNSRVQDTGKDRDGSESVIKTCLQQIDGCKNPEVKILEIGNDNWQSKIVFKY